MSTVLPARLHGARLEQPRCLDEALGLRAAHPRAVLLAGGTDLMVLVHAGKLAAEHWIDLSRVPELRGMALGPEGVRIGACTTFAQVLASPDLVAGWPLLLEAAAELGSVQIRNRATLGGNVVNASPAGDSLPALAAYGAQLELASARGTRQVPLTGFYHGYKQLELAADEILVAIEVPRPRPGAIQRYRKVGTRRAQAIAKLALALVVHRGPDACLHDARIALAAVGPTVLRLPRTEALLEGRVLTAELVDEARASVEGEVSPIDDIRSTAEYRRQVSGRILARFLGELG